jgi:phospholipid N-methyltransferase
MQLRNFLPVATKAEAITSASPPCSLLKTRVWLTFLREFIRHPAAVGTGFASSDALVERVLRTVDWRRVRRVVEFGPGTGAFTRAILERLPGDGRLIAFETSAEFIGYIRTRIDDPRCDLRHASADALLDHLEYSDIGAVDLIISGIPFSMLPRDVGASIVVKAAAVLAPQASFIAYQWSSAIASLLATRFRRVDKAFEWRNIPPCRIFRATNSVHGENEGPSSIHPAESTVSLAAQAGSVRSDHHGIHG